jgi:hypothetical protein
MKEPARKAFVLVVGIAVMLIGGCGGQNEPPSVKKSRTIAAENIELRKELTQSRKKIEKLKEQHSKEIDEQKTLLQTCLQSTGRLTAEKEVLKKKSRQNIRSQVKGVLDTVLEENKKLRESTGRLTAENTRLKAQIEELRI